MHFYEVWRDEISHATRIDLADLDTNHVFKKDLFLIILCPLLNIFIIFLIFSKIYAKSYSKRVIIKSGRFGARFNLCQNLYF